MNLIDMAQIWALRNEKNNPWDIFSTLEIDGRIDRDVLVNEIIRRCGSLTPVYNTSETFVYFTNHFFKREYNNIKSMLDLNEKEYEPLENFERIEKATKTSVSKAILDESDTGSKNDTGTENTDGSNNDNGTKNDSGSKSDNDTKTTNGSKSDSGTKTSNGSKSDTSTTVDDGSSEEKTSAYNENIYQPYKKTDNHNNNSYNNEHSYNDTTTHSDKIDYNDSSTRSNEITYNDNSIFNNNGTYNDNTTFNKNSVYSNKRDYTRDNDYKGEEDTTAHGINGLTTRQDLVLKERQLITFNIVTWIVEKYCMELFLQVF